MWIEPFVYKYMNKEECCGCEACKNICPVDALEMFPDKLGFSYPTIEDTLCIKCNRCVQVCPQLHKGEKVISGQVEVFAGYSLDDENVRDSSSGGIFTTMANAFLEKSDDARIVAVVWSDDFKFAYHVIGKADKIESMKKSKYIQSNKGYIYREIKNCLEKGEYILFVGCPCEVAGLVGFLKKKYEKLYLIDLVCQGPTSPKIMQDYIGDLEKRVKSKVQNINLRYNGGKTWIPQWININFKNGKNYKRVFYETDLGIAVHFMQRPSCYLCEWNGKRRLSDITLGDFHGAVCDAKYYNAAGTSVVIVNTDKGKDLFSIINSQVCFQKVEYDEIAKHNPRVENSWSPLPGADAFINIYKRSNLKKAAFKSLKFKKKIKYLLPTVLSNWINR